MVYVVNPSRFYVIQGHYEAWSAMVALREVAIFLGEMGVVQVLQVGLAPILVVEQYLTLRVEYSFCFQATKAQ